MIRYRKLNEASKLKFKNYSKSSDSKPWFGTEWMKLGNSLVRFDYMESDQELGVFLRENGGNLRHVGIIKINKYQVKAVCQAIWEALVNAEASSLDVFSDTLENFCKNSHIVFEGVFID